MADVKRVKGLPGVSGGGEPPGLVKVLYQQGKKLDVPVYMDPTSRQIVDPATYQAQQVTKATKLREKVAAIDKQYAAPAVEKKVEVPKGRAPGFIDPLKKGGLREGLWNNILGKKGGTASTDRITSLYKDMVERPDWVRKFHKQAWREFADNPDYYRRLIKKGKSGKYVMVGAAVASVAAMIGDAREAEAGVPKGKVLKGLYEQIIRAGVVPSQRSVNAEGLYANQLKKLLPSNTSYKTIKAGNRISSTQEVAVLKELPKKISEVPSGKFLYDPRKGEWYLSTSSTCTSSRIT